MGKELKQCIGIRTRKNTKQKARKNERVNTVFQLKKKYSPH